MDNTDKYIGQFLDNRYEILEKIGTGGMAVVYKARCHRLNRLVAVKILKEEFSDDADFRRRFHTESQAVAMMSHPNIVSVYDVSSSGKTEYIVMELIDGITLKQYINRKGALNWKESLHFATQVAKALSHAHSRGIIHRDIKPHNIMILKDGSVKVADFGIARLQSNQNTLTQEALGSVHYISPEQAKGSHVDARSDLYSLGVVMYEMLTGRLPFEGDSAVSVAIQHISAVPLMPREIDPSIPEGLENITMHAMEPRLNRRYASADEMLHDLEEFRKNPSIVFNYSPFDPTGVSGTEDEHTQAIPVDSIKKVETGRMVSKKTGVQTAGTKGSMTKEEYKKNKKKSSKTSTLVGIFCILAFLIIVFVFMWNYFLKDMLNPDEERIAVPTFVGQLYTDVTANEEYADFNFVEPEYDYSEEYAEGYVIAQNPKENRMVVREETGVDVTLTVSLGSEKPDTMINITGMDYRKAKIALENLGLNLNIELIPQNDDNITDGYVINQIPEEGEPLTEGGTVYITYSTGPEEKLVQVPEVTGLSVSQAKSRLESYDLSYSIEYVDSDADADEVIFQSYEPGEEVPLHTEVFLQVSNGPTYEPTTSPSEEPSDEPTTDIPTEPTVE
jgi:serine/threonine protein kinase